MKKQIFFPLILSIFSCSNFQLNFPDYITQDLISKEAEIQAEKIQQSCLPLQIGFCYSTKLGEKYTTTLYAVNHFYRNNTLFFYPEELSSEKNIQITNISIYKEGTEILSTKKNFISLSSLLPQEDYVLGVSFALEELLQEAKFKIYIY